MEVKASYKSVQKHLRVLEARKLLHIVIFSAISGSLIRACIPWGAPALFTMSHHLLIRSLGSMVHFHAVLECSLAVGWKPLRKSRITLQTPCSALLLVSPSAQIPAKKKPAFDMGCLCPLCH